MKIAYLMHTDREFDELVESINQLIKQDDHVFVIISDNDLRDKIFFVYAESKKVHIAATQDFAQPGDLSLARGTIIQLKEAVELGGFDYFINLSDGMMPLKTRDEIISFLEKSNTDYFYVHETEQENPSLRTKMIRYYPFTNLFSFRTKKFTRGFAKFWAKTFSIFGVTRKLEDTILIGSPYFMLTQKSARILADHFDYVSETFKLSWYAEEMYIQMMFDKFKIGPHINSDYRVLGPLGTWKTGTEASLLSHESITQHPEALFGGKILVDETPSLYETYFDVYNQ